ncbi:MAG: trypsin-like serine protease [Aestuariibacter sp.]|nr:trypsin-like serine protease [Aestuariibacter sp.]
MKLLNLQAAFMASLLVLSISAQADEELERLNNPPVIVYEALPITPTYTPYQYTVVGHDPDQDNLQYSLTSAPEGMTIDSQSGEIQWTPTVDQVGVRSVAVIVTDTGGLQAYQSFEVTVFDPTGNSPAIGDILGVAHPTDRVLISHSRIFGGFTSQLGARPYQVQIRDNVGRHHCGGTLIDAEWVLTAAHCVFTDSGLPSTDVFTVRVGVHTLSSNEGQVIDIAETITHPNYNWSSDENDIALLKLANKAPALLTPAKLPTQAIMNAVGSPNDIVTVSGWGLIDNGTMPDALQEVDLPIVSNALCNRPEIWNGEIKSHMICGGLVEGGLDACHGDSGGPMAASYNGDYYVIGVVSFGNGCALPNWYGVYSRTHSFLGWIESTTGIATDSGSNNCTESLNNAGGVLCNGSIHSISGTSDANNFQQTYILDTPVGATDLMVSILGDTSYDVDIYLRQGSAPLIDNSSWDCRPYKKGATENCSFTDPVAGTWNIGIVGLTDYSDVELTAGYTPSPVPLPQGRLVISEVLYDSLDSDKKREWVELYNGTTEAIDLSGYSLGHGRSDYTRSVAQLYGFVGPGKTFVIGGPISRSANSNPTFDQQLDFSPNFINPVVDAAGVALFDVPQSQITDTTIPIDAVVFGLQNSNDLIDETGAANPPDVAPAAPGMSIERISFTDTTTTWVIQAVPTPNSVPASLINNQTP